MSSVDPNDEEASTPFLGGKSRNNFSSLSEETSETTANDSKPSKLTPKRILVLCVSVVFLVTVVVVVSVVAVQRKNSVRRDLSNTSPDRILTLEDATMNDKYAFYTRTTKWVSDRTYLKSFGSLAEYDAETNRPVKTILTMEEMSYGNVQKISPDGQWFLFSNNSRKLYRHSFYADYFVKNLNTNVTVKIAPPGDDPQQIRYCDWGSVGNAVVFVHKCNIYYVPDAESLKKQYYKLTNTGVPKKVFNGVPDWVYEEEIIESTHAIEFSSDGRYMAYVTFDATKVPFFRFPFYGTQDHMYTTIEKIAYPKAGYPNPTIKITILDLHSAVAGAGSVKRSHVVPPVQISGGDYYYSVLKFNGPSELFVQWMNRAQNNTVCMMYATQGDNNNNNNDNNNNNNNGFVAEEHEVQHGWIDDDYVSPKFSTNGSYYVTMLPLTVGTLGEFRHLAKVSVDLTGRKAESIEYLTTGAYTVYRIDCWDPVAEVLYYRSNEMSVRSQHVYKYNLATNTKECVSCGLIRDPHDGTNCTYHSVAYSKKCSWLDLTCQGPFPPRKERVKLKSLETVLLEGNENTRAAILEKDLPTEHFYTVMSDGYTIHVKETRPKYFNPMKKYAVLFSVYGGPNHQKVTDFYNKITFDTHFVSSYDCILVHFDARGSGNYGYNFLYAVYRNLGQFESRDALAVAKHLQKQTYVDPERIGIWGWSYGGFFSSTVLAISQGVIKTAVAVAPVTDWRYYDTVYSERYMGFPSKEDNLAGYRSTSVMSKAIYFKGKNFFLIHGTADDNVHFQNSAQLVSALVDAQVMFRSQFYTDRDHNIRSRGHIYKLIADYLVKTLKLNSNLHL